MATLLLITFISGLGLSAAYALFMALISTD